MGNFAGRNSCGKFLLGKFLWEILAEKSCGIKILAGKSCVKILENLAGKSCRKILLGKFLQENLENVGKCYGKFLQENLVGKSSEILVGNFAGKSCGKFCGKSCRKILWENLVENFVGKSCRKLLWEILV